jgi:hypothetical protein
MTFKAGNLTQWNVQPVPPKRAEWNSINNTIQPELNAAHQKHQAAHEEWVKHATRAHANGFDPDIYPDARNLKLPEGK